MSCHHIILHGILINAHETSTKLSLGVALWTKLKMSVTRRNSNMCTQAAVKFFFFWFSSSEVDRFWGLHFSGICFLVVVMLQSCCARLTLETLTCRAGLDQTMTNVSYSSRLSISFFLLKTLARVLAQRHPLYRCIHIPSKKNRCIHQILK